MSRDEVLIRMVLQFLDDRGDVTFGDAFMESTVQDVLAAWHNPYGPKEAR